MSKVRARDSHSAGLSAHQLHSLVPTDGAARCVPLCLTGVRVIKIYVGGEHVGFVPPQRARAEIAPGPAVLVDMGLVLGVPASCLGGRAERGEHDHATGHRGRGAFDVQAAMAQAQERPGTPTLLRRSPWRRRVVC